MRRSLFLLPLAAVAAVAITYGPELWHTHYGPIKQFCEMYLTNPSAFAMASPALVALGGLGLSGGLLRLSLQVRSDTVLVRTMRAITVPAPAVLERAAYLAGVRGRVTCVDAKSPLAFCRGLLVPQIYVSTGLIATLDDEELRVVLAHEGAHAAGRDPLRLLLVRFIAGGAFFLPFARFLEERYLLSLELAADRRAIDAVSLSHLASALLKILEAQSRPALARGALAFNPTEERIQRLTAVAEEGWSVGRVLRPAARRLAWTVASVTIATAILALAPPVALSMTGCI